MHRLNVIVSRTNTLIGKSIRLVLGGEFNHCSIALDNDFNNIFSFSRRYHNLWFTGCFCKEDINSFDSFIVYTISISDKEYLDIHNFIEELSRSFRIYNYIGAIACIFGKGIAFNYNYICSTFVAKILSMLSSIELDKDVYEYKPMDIVNLLSNYDLSIVKRWLTIIV